MTLAVVQEHAKQNEPEIYFRFALFRFSTAFCKRETSFSKEQAS